MGKPDGVGAAAEFGRELAVVDGVHDGGEAVLGRRLLLFVRRRRGGGCGCRRVGAPRGRPERPAAGGREEAASCDRHRHWRNERGPELVGVPVP